MLTFADLLADNNQNRLALVNSLMVSRSGYHISEISGVASSISEGDNIHIFVFCIVNSF